MNVSAILQPGVDLSLFEVKNRLGIEDFDKCLKLHYPDNYS